MTLYEALDKTRCVVTLLSADYLQSSVCNEELNLALLKHLSQVSFTAALSTLLLTYIKSANSGLDCSPLSGIVIVFDFSVCEELMVNP